MMIARAMRDDVIDAWVIAASHVTRAMRCDHRQRIAGRKIFIAIMRDDGIERRNRATALVARKPA